MNFSFVYNVVVGVVLYLYVDERNCDGMWYLFEILCGNLLKMWEGEYEF